MQSITVMIQYVGHVVNAGGAVTYRKVELVLTPEQRRIIALTEDEYYGPMSIDDNLNNQVA